MGLGLDRLTEQQTIEMVLGAVRAGRGGCLFPANLHVLQNHQRDEVARRALTEATLVVADGMPLVWASRVQATPLPERVAGSNLIFSLTEAAAERGHSIFLLGGDPGVADRCAEALSERHPGVRIAGTLCPPFGFEDDPDEVARIEAALLGARPDIVYLALGFPKQERLALRLRTALPATWFVSVGISFSFACGEVVRAPRWMQRMGLEWLHRLAQEPRRLFRRYLVDGVPFALRVLAHAGRARLRPVTGN